MWREHFDSVYQNTGGVADARGLEYGDTAERDTWQLKIGPVLSPLGRGIYTRPSLRILYGLQYSNMQNAFGQNLESSLDQFNQFGAPVDHHWHSVVSLEAETWF
jgi:hypothetical protein